ncbi:Cytochrome P450 monooygenase 3, partial [Golovinomyces cichoracearum]
STISEINSFTDKEISHQDFFRGLFYSKFTGIGELDYPTLVSVIKNDISRQLASSLDIMQHEIVPGFNYCLGRCDDWTSFQIYQTVAKIVAMVSARVFVGRPLNRNEEWINANINFTFEVINVKNALSKWPRWKVNIFGQYCNEVKSIQKFKKQYAKLVQPLIDSHLAKEGNEKLYDDDGNEQGNVLACILARMSPEEHKIPGFLVNQLLNLSFASIHTTTVTVTNFIYDLASHREYIPLLLDEINEVMAEDGYVPTEDGIFKLRKTSLPKLLKLDSFLKESQRVNSASLVSHVRTTTSNLMISSGHLIPKGTSFCIPSWEIHNGSTALYSDGHTKPLDEFDGLRYYNLSRLLGNANRHFFVTTSPHSLAFGHGKHSCPGRFFANNEIKVVLIELIRNWEFRFPDDVKLEGGEWRRPKNKYSGVESFPDMTANLEIRRRKN